MSTFKDIFVEVVSALINIGLYYVLIYKFLLLHLFGYTPIDAAVITLILMVGTVYMNLSRKLDL